MARLKPELQTQLPPSPQPAEEEIIDAEFATALVPVTPGSLPAAAGSGLAEVSALAQVFARSGFFADARQLSQACVKILAGRDLGLPPIAAMTGLYVVKGRVTLSANLMAALIRRHPRYEYQVVTLTPQACEIAFTCDGQPIGQSQFTIEDARLAGVAHGDNWKKYPRNMLFARALSNGCRWFCPDVFGAPVYEPDEIGATGTHVAEGLVEAAGLLPEAE